MEERELVRKLLAGNEEAERYFFLTYREKMYKVCVYLLGYRDPDAEDITQEAFIIALRKLPEFEFRSTLYSWLYRICVHLCYERIDKRGRQVAHLQEELEALAGPAMAESQLKEEEESEKAKMLDLLETQRNLLGNDCRGILELRDKNGVSYAQISETLKVPIGTVMSRLARCREALKKLMWKALRRDKDDGPA